MKTSEPNIAAAKFKANKDISMRQLIANMLSLFTSSSTLICCAIPSLLVTLGAGTVVASLVSAAPWLAWLSRYKLWLFCFAGLMIALNVFLVYRPRGRVACAIGRGKACEEASRLNKVILWISAGMYLFGLFMAFLLLPLRVALGW